MALRLSFVFAALLAGAEAERHAERPRDSLAKVATDAENESAVQQDATQTCATERTLTGIGWGYPEPFRGWFDIQGCGKCYDYCRWVGDYGPGGNPVRSMVYREAWWSCSLAGSTEDYTRQDGAVPYFNRWNWKKCSGLGATAPQSKCWSRRMLHRYVEAGESRCHESVPYSGSPRCGWTSFALAKAMCEVSPDCIAIERERGVCNGHYQLVRGGQVVRYDFNVAGKDLWAYSPDCSQTWWSTSCVPVTSEKGNKFFDGYPDSYRGWFDVTGCGTCNDYCRWVGDSGSGGNPKSRLIHGRSFWSCRLAGSAAHTPRGHFKSWPIVRCAPP